jgi:hypothetical protein
MSSSSSDSAPKVQRLLYRLPVQGRDWWQLDGALPDPMAARQRLLARTDWVLGSPYRPEIWPGRRAQPALTDEELAPLEVWARKATGQKKLFSVSSGSGTLLNHNCVQVVAAAEGHVKPHTDSRRLCKYAGVLYLNPDVPDHCGTALYRVRLPDGSLGGNTLPSRYANLVEALGTRRVSPDLFVEDMTFEHRFNRFVLYKADLIHSATAYWGEPVSDSRMTVVLFWMA